jgi:hypothetical protein
MSGRHGHPLRAAGLALASLCLLALPASASAATLNGATETGAGVKLSVNLSGKPTAFRVAKFEVRCHNGTLTAGPARFGNLDKARAGLFRERGKQQSKDGRYKLLTTTNISGALASTGVWGGSFSYVTRVVKRKSGRTIDRCKLKTKWSASP